MKALPLLLALLCASAHAADLQVTVKQITGTASKSTPPVVTAYQIDPLSMHVSRTKPTAGRVLPEIHKYTVANGKLTAAGRPLTSAAEILFQTRSAEDDLVVIRDESNSWLGPLNLFLFLASHPVQVSKITVVKVASGQLIARKELMRREASYHWVATISK